MTRDTSVDDRPAEPGPAGPGSAGLFAEAWSYRELFLFFAWRDIKVRYKQTLFGILWALIQPLVTMLIFTLVFGRLAGMPSDGMPAPVFYYSGLLPWLYFSSTVSNASMSLVANSGLLTKIYFPRIVLPASAALSGLLDFLVGSVLLGGFIAWYRLPIGWTLALWPALVVVLLVFSLSVGLLLAALNVQYRDVKYALPFLVQLWMFASPVIYPSSMAPESLRLLLAINPMTGLLEAFRVVVFPSAPLHWGYLGLSLASTAVLAVVATLYFRRTERVIADVI